MTYPEALAYISRIGRFGMKLGTERTRAILDRMGEPDRGLAGALIAGTNGKGSTGACLASILQAAGHVVGFMPKPHLVSYTERIQIDGIPITEGHFAQTLEDLQPTLEVIADEMGPATEFEMLTAMAVAYLAPRVDRLVCEVGLGGRLDATNTIDLGVAAITKSGNRVLTGCEGSALAIVEDFARNAGAALWRLGEEIQVESTSRRWDGHLVSVAGPGFEHKRLAVPLVGDYQPANAALAVATAHALDDVSDDAVRQGLARTTWPGRLQVIDTRPRVILDGGHNPAAMTKSGVSLRRLIGSERLVTVFSMLSERDPAALLAALQTLRPDRAVFTEATSAGGHSVPAVELASMFGNDAEAVLPPKAALGRARELAGEDGNVLVCGSLYLVGEILALRE